MSSAKIRGPREIFAIVKRLHDRDLHGHMVEICKRYKVTLEGVLSGKKTARVAEARDACIASLVQFHFSIGETAELFDMDPSSISYAKRRHAKREIASAS